MTFHNQRTLVQSQPYTLQADKKEKNKGNTLEFIFFGTHEDSLAKSVASGNSNLHTGYMPANMFFAAAWALAMLDSITQGEYRDMF